MATPKLPAKLSKPPVVEAIFEFRFEPTKDSVGDILVGILYYSKGFGVQKIEPLPAASIPREVRESNPNLRYLASHRLHANSTYITVGDRVMTFAYAPTYEGWKEFRENAVMLLKVAKETGLVGSAERYSLKYLNLLQAPLGSQLSLLNARFEISGESISDERGFRFRTEQHRDGFVTIFELVTAAGAQLPDGLRNGLMLTVDTICSENTDGIWDDPYRCLDALHDHLKANFFGILKDQTIKAFGPSWDNDDLH